MLNNFLEKILYSNKPESIRKLEGRLKSFKKDSHSLKYLSREIKDISRNVLIKESR